MTYNNDTQAFAPLPSGALPTDEELRRLAGHSRKMQSEYLMKSLRRVFKR